MNRTTCITLTAIAIVAAGAVCAIAPREVAAQGCAMCYQSAAASGARAIAALRHGILILAIPPVLICGGIARLAYLRRNVQAQTPASGD
jgi:hypothetical protein